MLEILAHSNLSHQLVLVAIHTRKLPDVCKNILKAISQLQGAAKQYMYIVSKPDSPGAKAAKCHV